MPLEAVSGWPQKTQTFTSPSYPQRSAPCLFLLTLLTDLDTPLTAGLGSTNLGDAYKLLNSPGEFLHHLSLRIRWENTFFLLMLGAEGSDREGHTHFNNSANNSITKYSF